MKENVRKEHYMRVCLLLNSELNLQNLLLAIFVCCCGAILNWTNANIKGMNIKRRKRLTTHRIHHPKANDDNL